MWISKENDGIVLALLDNSSIVFDLPPKHFISSWSPEAFVWHSRNTPSRRRMECYSQKGEKPVREMQIGLEKNKP